MTANLSRIAKSKRVLAQPLEDGIMLLNLEDGQYYRFDGTAAAMWRTLTDTGSADETLQRLQQIYDIKREKLRDDLDNFIGELDQRGLITVLPQ